MIRVLVSQDAFEDLNEGFLFYEAQQFGLGDYFAACLRPSISGAILLGFLLSCSGSSAHSAECT